MKSPNLKKLVYPLCTGITLAVVQLGLSGAVLAADCPAATVADSKGVPLDNFHSSMNLLSLKNSAGKCTMKFSENPDIAKLNGKIYGNPKLPSLAERLP